MRILAVKQWLKRGILSVPFGRWMYEKVYRPLIAMLARQMARRRLRRVGPEILEKVFSLCEREKIPCFVDYGTLLGCVREHSFIRHDDDIDFGLFSGSVDVARFVRCLLADGFTFKRGFLFEGKLTEIAFFYKGISVDFFFHFLEESHLWAQCYGTGGSIPKHDEKIPVLSVVRTYRPCIPALKQSCLSGVKVLIPANAEEVLRAHYGSGWKIPDSHWNRAGEGDYCVKKTIDEKAYVVGKDYVMCEEV